MSLRSSELVWWAVQLRKVSVGQIAVTMDVYSQVTSDSTLRALKALGERLEGH
jgi:hypothetical protein